MSEWQEIELGKIASVQSGYAFSSSHFTSDGVPVIRMSDLENGRLNLSNSERLPFSFLNQFSHFSLCEGDLVIGMSGSLDNYAIVRSNDLPALLNQRVGRFVLRDPERFDYTFLYYLVCSNEYRSHIQRVAAGAAQKNVSSNQIENFVFKKPEKNEQRRIAEILSSVDAQIEHTESLIDKYQQIKAGMMHDLFTRGVDAHVRLRPPREQAPEMFQKTKQGFFPKDWKQDKLGNMADIVSGVTLGNKMDGLTCVEVPYLRVANVQDGYLDLSDVKSIKVSATQCEKLLLQKGDVLMNEGGDFDKLGRGTVWRGEISRCIHQNHVFRVRPNTNKLRSNYLAFWSQSEFGKRYFVLSSKQSTNLASINSTQLHAFPIMLPEIEEQERIENRIKAITDRLDQLNADLSKYRFIKSGLMHDLLTGRVPVKVTEPDKQEAVA